MNPVDCDTDCAALDSVTEGTNLVVAANADADEDTAFAGCKYKLVAADAVQFPATVIAATGSSFSVEALVMDGSAVAPIPIPLQVSERLSNPLIMRGDLGYIAKYQPKQVAGKFRIISKPGLGIGPVPFSFPVLFADDLEETANPDFYLGANDVQLICSNGDGPIQLLKIENLGDPPALPLAIDDAIEVEFETEFNFNPRSNDTGIGIEVTVVSNPPHGTATIEMDGSVSYLPDDGFFGTDSFTYTIVDDSLNPDTATVTVTVLPPVPMLAWWDASGLAGADDDPIALLPDLVDELDFTATTPEAYRVYKGAKSGSAGSNVYWWAELRTGSSGGPVVETILLGASIAEPPNYFLPAYDISRSFEFWLVKYIGDINGPIGSPIGISEQSILVTAPTLQLAAQNGLNTLLFSANAAMTAAVDSSWGITDAGTIFLVIKQISGTAPIFNFDNPNNTNRFGFVYDASGSIYMMWGDVGAGTGIRDLVYAVDTNWTVLTLRRSGNGFELFRDGASIWVPSDFASALIWNGASALSLANSSQALSVFKSFELGEMMIFPSALPAPEIETIEAFLGDKWDITIT